MDKRKSNIKYDIDNLAELFGIQAVEKSMVLEKWLSSTATLTLEEKNMIETLRQRLIKSGSSWNEEELKIQFIGILFFIINIDEEKIIKTFFERPMSAIVQNIPLNVIADCLIATPKGLGGSPREPYFFLQEYKKTKGDKQDPEGQMLTAMLIAQASNLDEKPIYGCWIVGNNWHFTVLNGSFYSVSQQFDATQNEDLLQIVYMLRSLKILILNR